MAESNIHSRRVAERADYEFEAKIHADLIISDGKIENTLIYYKLY